MRILLIGSAYPFRGGLASYNERLVRELIKMKHHASIFTFTLQYPSFLFPGTTQFSNSPPPSDIVIQRKVNSINPFNWLKIGWHIRATKPDVVIFKYWLPFMGPCFGTIARIAKSNKHTKVITILDNVIPHEPRIGDRMFTKYFLPVNNAFIAMSQSVLDDLRKFLPHVTCQLNPHPLFDNFGDAVSKAMAKTTLHLDADCCYILFFGFIRDYKGLDILLDAMALIKSQNKLAQKFKLIIAGEFYADSAPYLRQIQALGITDEIVLRTDFIEDENVKYYFCAADLVVQPYKHATQSGVTQICYHFNKPMLVTNVGGLAEIVPNHRVGYVCNIDAQEIADAIVDFYQNSREQNFIEGIAGEKQKYSWRTMAEKLLAMVSN